MYINSIYDLLVSTSIKYPNNKFILYPISINYINALNYVHSIAIKENLTNIAHRKIAILSEKRVESILIPFAISMTSNIFINLSDKYTVNYVIYAIKKLEIDALFTSNQYSEMVPTILNKCPNLTIYNIDSIPYNNSDNNIDISKYYPCRIKSDVACMFMTSGSTGKPKGVVTPNATLVDGANIVSNYLNMCKNDILVAALPLSFDYGFNQICNAIYKGASLIVCDYLLPNKFLSLIKEYNVTGIAGVPAMWYILHKFLSRKVNSSEYFSTLRFMTNTGGKIPKNILLQILNIVPDIDFYYMYGLTESFRSSYTLIDKDNIKPNLIGKSINGVDIQIIDKNGNICKEKKIGQIVHRGALISYGYYGDTCNKIFSPDPLDNSLPKVVYSGDLGYKDADGNIYYVGRINEQLKSRGFRINLSELEEELDKIDKILDYLVLTEKNEIEEVIIYLCILTQLNYDDKVGIVNNINAIIPEYMKPKKIQLFEQWPLSSNGKIDVKQVKKIIGLNK